jgi:FtsH-binding integral membrane protein
MSRQTQKRCFWAVVLVMIAGIAGLISVAARGPHYNYRAYTIVTIVLPFTNAVLSASFQATTFRSLPSVRLVTSGTKVVRVVADGATVTEARNRSKDATESLKVAVQHEFGATLSVLDSGDRPMGAFHRALERLGL